jgi:RNA polymerase sigma factor (TIGR02999 family)
MGRQDMNRAFDPPVAGEAIAPSAAFTAAYDRLKAMAHRELDRAPPGTVSTTELVHELYLRLGDELSFGAPDQFFAYAARAIRHILVDRARHRLSFKAGGDQRAVSLTDPAVNVLAAEPELALQLDRALDELAAANPRAAQVVELHYFGGLGLEQVAQLLGVVRRTVDRDWRQARAYLLARVE